MKNVSATDLKHKLGQVLNLEEGGTVEAKTFADPGSDAKFLLSLAGIFDSGVADTSENVKAIVTDFLLPKQTEPLEGVQTHVAPLYY
jgi:hypothetical protein